jgi:hypothetical protein
MSGSAPDIFEERRDKVRAELAAQLGEGDVLSALRSKLLRGLANSNFEEAGKDWDDYRILRPEIGGARRDSTSLARRTHALELEEVRTFVKKFFQLAPEERSARWRRLTAATAFPPAALRLQLLAKACDLDLDVLPTDPLQKEIAQCALTLFAATAQDLVPIRLAFLAGRKGSANWRSAARRLRNDHPRFAGLDSVLLDELIAPLPRSITGLPPFSLNAGEEQSPAPFPLTFVLWCIAGICVAWMLANLGPTSGADQKQAEAFEKKFDEEFAKFRSSMPTEPPFPEIKKQEKKLQELLKLLDDVWENALPDFVPGVTPPIDEKKTLQQVNARKLTNRLAALKHHPPATEGDRRLIGRLEKLNADFREATRERLMRAIDVWENAMSNDEAVADAIRMGLTGFLDAFERDKKMRENYGPPRR